jgi:hypothetical protein
MIETLTPLLISRNLQSPQELRIEPVDSLSKERGTKQEARHFSDG